MKISEFFNKETKIFPFGKKIFTEANEYFTFIRGPKSPSNYTSIHLVKYDSFVSKSTGLFNVRDNGVTEEHAREFFIDLDVLHLDDGRTLSGYFKPSLPFGTVVEDFGGKRYAFVEFDDDRIGLIDIGAGKVVNVNYCPLGERLYEHRIQELLKCVENNWEDMRIIGDLWELIE